MSPRERDTSQFPLGLRRRFGACACRKCYSFGQMCLLGLSLVLQVDWATVDLGLSSSLSRMVNGLSWNVSRVEAGCYGLWVESDPDPDPRDPFFFT